MLVIKWDRYITPYIVSKLLAIILNIMKNKTTSVDEHFENETIDVRLKKLQLISKVCK